MFLSRKSYIPKKRSNRLETVCREIIDVRYAWYSNIARCQIKEQRLELARSLLDSAWVKEPGTWCCMYELKCVHLTLSPFGRFCVYNHNSNGKDTRSDSYLTCSLSVFGSAPHRAQT